MFFEAKTLRALLTRRSCFELAKSACLDISAQSSLGRSAAPSKTGPGIPVTTHDWLPKELLTYRQSFPEGTLAEHGVERWLVA